MHLLAGGPGRAWNFFSGLRRLEKTLKYSRCIHVIDLVLKCGSDINEGNWLQSLFYLIVLMATVASVTGLSFFSAMFQVLDLSSPVLYFYRNVFTWIPKVIWPRMDWFWGFLLKNGSFCWLHVCMNWNFQELLKCHLFFVDIKSFR